MFCYEKPVSTFRNYVVNALLLIQLCGSIQPVIEDIRYPFSNAYRINELIDEAPAGEKVVTDYWTLNAASAFADRPFYCVDLQKEISYIIWDSQFKKMVSSSTRFTDGIKNLFSKEKIKSVLIISINPPDILAKIDARLQQEYTVTLMDKREGAIERASNLYLYRVNEK